MSEIARLHYVYAHRRASDDAIFYIGKGKGRRAWSASGRNRHWKFVTNKHGFRAQIIKDGLPESCALSLEKIMIARIGLSGLTNATFGGGGIPGWKHSDDTKRRIGAFHKGREFTPKMRAALELANKSRVFRPETREKMSLAKLGKPRGPLSAETRAKISASHMGIKPSPETLRKMSLSKIGKACGRESPTYDHTIRTFYHAEYPEFTGTRADFIATYGLSDPCVSAVITGRQKSVKGWRMK